jgi:hypothetical protein
MELNWNNSILSSKQQNDSVNDYLNNLFVENWSTQMNYSKYFDECAPSYCTYTTTDQTDFSYAVTMLISLYGGLITIFRLIVPFLINVLVKIRHRSRNIDDDLSMY